MLLAHRVHFDREVSWFFASDVAWPMISETKLAASSSTTTPCRSRSRGTNLTVGTARASWLMSWKTRGGTIRAQVPYSALKRVKAAQGSRLIEQQEYLVFGARQVLAARQRVNDAPHHHAQEAGVNREFLLVDDQVDAWRLRSPARRARRWRWC